MSLNIPLSNIIRVYINGNSLVHSTRTKKETSFCAYPKASLTIEAAVVLPLTMSFLFVFLFFFRVLFVQSVIEEALIYTGRVMAIESMITEDEAALYVSAEAIFKKKILENKDVGRYVMGGIMGVSLLDSEMNENPIELKADCMVLFPINLFGFQGIRLSSVNHFVKWNGDVYKEDSQKQWVYITETGHVYHRDTCCRSLDLSIQQGLLSEMSIYRGASGQKYKACSRCLDDVGLLEIVYFTNYGQLYHGKLTCSSLKRTISKVLLTQVEDRRPCSFCY